MSLALRQPPYSRQLREAMSQLQPRPAVWLYFGSSEAWDRADRLARNGWRNVLALPPDLQPSAIDWSCCAGLSVVAVEMAPTTPELRESLVRCLAVHGARDAYLIPHSCSAADAVLWNCGPVRKESAE